MTAQPIWCDPPPAVRSLWRELLDPVTERPGDWALVRTYGRHSSAVDAVRKLRLASRGGGNVVIPEGQWEFVQRPIERHKPEWGVWARYGGDE